MQWQRERLKVRGEKKVDGKSTLYFPKAQPAHMGRYICLEEASQETASIYVYVKGTGTPDLERVCKCLLERREVKSRAKQKCCFLPHVLDLCVGVFAGEKKGVCNLARDRYSRDCSYCVHYLVVLYFLLCVTPHPLARRHDFRLIS